MVTFGSYCLGDEVSIVKDHNSFPDILSFEQHYNIFSLKLYNPQRTLSPQNLQKVCCCLFRAVTLQHTVKYPELGNPTETVRRSQRCKLMADDVYLISYFVTVIFLVLAMLAWQSMLHVTPCHVTSLLASLSLWQEHSCVRYKSFSLKTIPEW